jgi:hypothetical protein
LNKSLLNFAAELRIQDGRQWHTGDTAVGAADQDSRPGVDFNNANLVRFFF